MRPWGSGAHAHARGVLILGPGALSEGPQLLWSASPLSTAVLPWTEDAWVDVPDTRVALELLNEAVLVISYDVSVLHADRALEFAAAEADAGELSFRVDVDGTPYRQSATTVDDREPLVAVASGSLILDVPGGQHNVTLQWRRRGARVQQWVVMSDVLDGFAGGRHLHVSAQHRFIWYTQPLSHAQVESDDVWEVVPDMALSFRLPEVSSVRFLYQLPVRPDVVQYSRGTIGALCGDGTGRHCEMRGADNELLFCSLDMAS